MRRHHYFQYLEPNSMAVIPSRTERVSYFENVFILHFKQNNYGLVRELCRDDRHNLLRGYLRKTHLKIYKNTQDRPMKFLMPI